jgi:predicted transcriptional regulator
MKLERHKYITKINKLYHINPMSEIYFTTFMDFKNTVDLINNYDAFWDKHNLGQLSLESVKNITDLQDSQLVEATLVDIFKTHNTIKKQLMKSKNIKAIFPYLHPEYPRIIEKILKNNGSLELIMPEAIFNETIGRINKKVREKSIKNNRLKIHVFDDDLDLYLTICDENMSLGLFKNDGSFDQNRILISNNVQSRNWAEELFRYIKNQVVE